MLCVKGTVKAELENYSKQAGHSGCWSSQGPWYAPPAASASAVAVTLASTPSPIHETDGIAITAISAMSSAISTKAAATSECLDCLSFKIRNFITCYSLVAGSPCVINGRTSSIGFYPFARVFQWCDRASGLSSFEATCLLVWQKGRTGLMGQNKDL